jgi:hypothetical protein
MQLALPYFKPDKWQLFSPVNGEKVYHSLKNARTKV